MPAPPGCADHRGCAVEPHAQHLPQRGVRPRQREAWLGDPVSGTATDDGRAHTRGEQVCTDDLTAFEVTFVLKVPYYTPFQIFSYQFSN